MAQTQTSKTKNRTPAKPAPAPAPVQEAKPEGAQESFRHLQRYMRETVCMRRADGSFVSGRLRSIAADEEIGDVVATLVIGSGDDESVEKVTLGELRWWYPLRAGTPSGAPRQPKRTGIPTIVRLPAGASVEDLLAAAGIATGETLTLADDQEAIDLPADPDDDGDDPDADEDWEDDASSTYVNEFEQADEIEAGEPFTVDELIDDESVAALDAAIAAQVPPETPAQAQDHDHDHDLTELGEQIDAALKRSPRAAKAAASRAYPKAAQVAKGGAKKPAKK